VFRNDEIALEKVKEYDKLFITGPGLLRRAGLCCHIKNIPVRRSILERMSGAPGNREAFAKANQPFEVYHGVATIVIVNAIVNC